MYYRDSTKKIRALYFWSIKKKIMKKLIYLSMAIAFLGSCQNDDRDAAIPRGNATGEFPLAESHADCGYIDSSWGSDAYSNNFIVDAEHTAFMYSQNGKMSQFFNMSPVPLQFVHDDTDTASTINAMSYREGYILFGEALYRKAISKGGKITAAMILAHEMGHQLQYSHNLPTLQENTARARELEADGFAGYYLRKPTGYNAAWQEAGPAFSFGAETGDDNTSSPEHHGTSSQRRSAVRLGWHLGELTLSVAQFDYYFFYYYNLVLQGAYRHGSAEPKDTEIDPGIHEFMLAKIEELRKINSGEISKEEFEKLD